MDRRDILLTIKNAIEGLQVTIRDKVRTIHTTDTLFDPTQEANLPMFSITPGPETGTLGLYGMSIDENFKVDIFGFTDGGSFNKVEENRESLLSKAAEDIVEVVKQKLISATFIDQIECAFSIISIGPVVVEHAELEDFLAYISIPLTIQYLFVQA
jgi:hypothetical protein